MTLGFKPFTVTDAQVDLELKGNLQSDGCYLDPEKYDPVKLLGSGGYAMVKGTNSVCIEDVEAFLGVYVFPQASAGLSKVAGCRQKSPPTWLVSAGYSAWHFFTDGLFK